MSWLRRLAVAVSLILVGLLAFAATTLAFDARGLTSGQFLGKGGGGGGLLPAAGNYRNSSVTAGFFACCAGPNGTMQVSLFVSHNKTASNPLVGPSSSTDEVDVQFSVNDFTSGLFASGCIIPDGASDFTVNASLTSATLNTTVQATTKLCQDQTLNGVTPPFSLNAIFTVTGATGAGTTLGRYSCGAYRSETLTTNGGSSNATASFAASFLTGTIAVTGANLFSFAQTIHVQGTAANGCDPLGGKGAGPGPQAPGQYTSSSMSASMSVQPDDSSQSPFDVFVTSFTNSAHPVGGPISTLTETDLNLFQFNFFQFVEDCWVIPASDLSIASDLHTASLNVSIDTTTQACQFANNTGPSVFTINATWNATSPVASFTNQSEGGCGTFHVAASQQESAVAATASGAWPGTAAAFTDTNASIGTNNTTTHVQGTFSGC